MYKNFLIVASKKDKAGINITTALSQYGKYNFHLVEEDILHEENFNSDKIRQADFVIFASKHKSEKKERTLSIHAPGNWADALYGGKPGKVSKTSAQFLKQCIVKLKKNTEDYKLDYKVTMECTHHGPLINKPCMFIEIGSTDMEWNDRRAAFAVAKTIREMIEEFKENPYNENVIAIGGPHYCQSFNKIQLESNIAISHVIPNYVLPLTESMVKQAVEKTEEEVDFALLDWKGIKRSADRQQVKEVLDKLYISHKRTSQVNKEY
jgi:D-aminoacyl-tRNA deacylase